MIPRFLAVLALPVGLIATEHFGHAPVSATQWTFREDVVRVANLPSRHYWYEVNGDPTFYFHGNTAALNEVLKRFAEVAGEKELVLLPGPSGARTLLSKPTECDWQLRAPAGLYAHVAEKEQGTRVADHCPKLTVWVAETRPTLPADAPGPAALIRDLASPEAAVRDKATQELTKLGHTDAAALRRALATVSIAEQRSRIVRLLGQLRGVALDQIEIPAGVTVFSVGELLQRARDGLKSADHNIRGMAAGRLSGLAVYADDVVPTLIDLCKPGQNEYVRR